MSAKSASKRLYNALLIEVLRAKFCLSDQIDPVKRRPRLRERTKPGRNAPVAGLISVLSVSLRESWPA
jgi:hypothetical protein